MTKPVTASIDLPCAPDAAMGLFVQRFTHWWPREYTWSQEALEHIFIDVESTGLCTEIGPNGFRCDWGTVLAHEPSKRLVFAWQISPRREPIPDPEKAGRVEVAAEPQGSGGTRLTLTHGDFGRYGEEGGAYAEMMGSKQGWPYILKRFRDFVEAL